MFTDNPFLAVAEFLSPLFMPIYVVLMILAVIGGTLFDLYHKRSATFFARQRRRARAVATRRPGSGELAVLAARTLLHEVATSGEFCNPRRRISHLLMSYGFVLYLLSTIVLVFGYAAEPHPPPLLPLLWNFGALMVLIGGYWFFFFLRVDVAHEGHSPWRLVRADLFIVSLLASISFALLFEIATMGQGIVLSRVFFALYLFFTTLLFVSVPWSKFAHMFYKPVMAFQRRVEEAEGSSSLPTPAEGRTRR